MTYQETRQYLDKFINYEEKPSFSYTKSFRLERIEDFLKEINNPHRCLNFIHIAGTKGKGSISIYVASILREAGFKVGIYTSPHLVDFRERIRLLLPRAEIAPGKFHDEFEGKISEEEITRAIQCLKPHIERFNKKSRFGSLSFFEVYTALALFYFKEKKTDFVVLETGLGGRLDATNVVDSLVCGISPISYEHTKQLGNTLPKIATEKLGVVKNRLENKKPIPQVVVSSPQDKEVMQLVRKTAKERCARLFEVGRDIFFEEITSSQEGQEFNVKGILREYPYLVSNLLGSHQLINASCAVGIVEGLSLHNIFVSPQAVRRGIENAIWPGRFEIVRKDPFIVLDGAQNIASAKALKDTIKKLFSDKRLILVLGISQDKDIKGICKVLGDIADIVILTKADNPRAAKPEQIRTKISRLKSKIFLTKTVREALELAQSKAIGEDLIVITGSLFVVGKAREIILEEKHRS